MKRNRYSSPETDMEAFDVSIPLLSDSSDSSASSTIEDFVDNGDMITW